MEKSKLKKVTWKISDYNWKNDFLIRLSLYLISVLFAYIGIVLLNCMLF